MVALIARADAFAREGDGLEMGLLFSERKNSAL